MTRSAKRNSRAKERRGAVRAERVVAIRHRLHRSSSKKTEESWSLSTTRNMSLTGILFLSEVPYAARDIVELSVTLSVLVEIFQGFGEVVRVVQKAGRAYEVAVRFVPMKPAPASRRAKSHL